MEKKFRVKFYFQKDGENPKFNFSLDGENLKKEAFAIGRGRLVLIADCDLDLGLSESSEDDVIKEIDLIKMGSTKYYFKQKQRTWFFKVFSKVCKSQIETT